MISLIIIVVVVVVVVVVVIISLIVTYYYLLGPTISFFSNPPSESSTPLTISVIIVIGLAIFGVMAISIFFIEPVIDKLYPLPPPCVYGDDYAPPSNCYSAGGIYPPPLYNIEKFFIAFFTLYFSSIFVSSFIAGWLGANNAISLKYSLISGLAIGGLGSLLFALVAMIIADLGERSIEFGVFLMACLGIPASILGLMASIIGNVVRRRFQRQAAM